MFEQGVQGSDCLGKCEPFKELKRPHWTETQSVSPDGRQGSGWVCRGEQWKSPEELQVPAEEFGLGPWGVEALKRF